MKSLIRLRPPLVGPQSLCGVFVLSIGRWIFCWFSSWDWVRSRSFSLHIYWCLKMHNIPYKHRFIAGSSKCSTKPSSILLTNLFTYIKQGFQKFYETAYSRSGINQMWILKNLKELLDHLKSPSINLITIINSFDFSTLYTNLSSPET